MSGQIGLEPFSFRKVSDMITELDFEGLISCQLVSRERLGRTSLIGWPFNPFMDRIYERETQERFRQKNRHAAVFCSYGGLRQADAFLESMLTPEAL